MGKTRITSGKVSILSGAKVKLRNEFEYNTGLIFPHLVIENQFQAPEDAILGASNLASDEGGEGTLGFDDNSTGFLMRFNITSNDIPLNSTITKREFFYKTRFIIDPNEANNTNIVPPGTILHYQPSIGIFVNNKDFIAQPGTFAYDTNGNSFTMAGEIRNNENYPSEPYVETFNSPAGTFNSIFYPGFFPQIEKTDLFSDNSLAPIQVKIARRGSLEQPNGENFGEGINSMNRTEVGHAPTTEGQSYGKAYKIGILKDSTGPALKISYKFSLE